MTPEELTMLALKCGLHRMHERDGTWRFLNAFERAIRQSERDRCCAVVYAQCGSDNAAQRTVDAIRREA